MRAEQKLFNLGWEKGIWDETVEIEVLENTYIQYFQERVSGTCVILIDVLDEEITFYNWTNKETNVMWVNKELIQILLELLEELG